MKPIVGIWEHELLGHSEEYIPVRAYSNKQEKFTQCLGNAGPKS